MKSRFERAVNKVERRLSQLYFETHYKLQLKIGVVKKTQIVTPDGEGEKVALFKPNTVETFEFPKVFNFIRKASFTIEYPEIALWKFSNATVFCDSDIVITEKGNAVWQKYFYYNYAKNIVGDANFVNEEHGIISYKKAKRTIEVDTAFSLIGVFSHVWAHVLVEYYPKFLVIKDAIADSKGKVTVLVPEIKDAQTNQIIYDELKKYDIDILVVHKGDAVKTHTLYYIERPTRFTDHEDCLAPGDMAVPKVVADYLRTHLVLPRTVGISKDPKYSKLFLLRRGGIGKGLLNVEEVEDYFRNKGFYFVEPHKVSLEEKIKIFYSAEVIVGPLGSAFTNLVFCRPGTKVMQFSNYQRLFENYISMQIQYNGIDVLYVTGEDDKNAYNMTHCSYYVPLEKIKAAATYHGIL